MPENHVNELPIILTLSSEAASLPLAGGKGANLARLTLAGLPVPDGFMVTTHAYRAFLAANGLPEKIAAALPSGETEDPETLECASARIWALFTAGLMPPDLEQELLAAYTRLGEPPRRSTGDASGSPDASGALPVAVRSSATAEDLPEMSFAGQQDTYLNVVGGPELLKAVVQCWGSLWSARAIGYRARNRVDHASAALAVVVQKMVQSQFSGVLFTANPVTGLRSEIVIDAAFGLGEALVSGQVEPDHYVVDSAAQRILSKTLGSKAVSIHGLAGGGTAAFTQAAGDRQALADEQILALARLGQQAAAHYADPQDIEWAWADGQFFLLQSRPITSLFPIPEGVSPEPLKVFFSIGAVQGMLDPFTPLGRDVLQALFATGARLFGSQVTSQTQTVVYTAGERLWSNITPIVSNTAGRRIARAVFGFVEPGSSQALARILEDPRLAPERPGVRPRTVLRLARFFIPVAGNLILNLVSPKKRREQIVGASEDILASMQARAQKIRVDHSGDRRKRLAQLAVLFPRLAEEWLPRTFVRFVSLVGAGMASYNLLNRITAGLVSSNSGEREAGWAASRAVSWDDLIMEVSRGVPNNPTTEMDLALWQAARSIQKDPPSAHVFLGTPAPELAACYQAGELPAAAQGAIDRFLARYGGRGLAELDIGRPRWREDPTHVIDSLRSYLQIQDEFMAPDAVFARSAHTADEAVSRLVELARRSRHGWLKARLVRFFAGRARSLLGARESPKFFAVRMLGILREALLETGQELVQAGELERPEDLFFLTLAELEAFAGSRPSEIGEWRERITGRREKYQREMLRRQIPRLLLSDGRAFYEGIRPAAESGQTITGSPVSPGSVTGRVRVVLDPRQAHLQPGEILVCPGTDPSWTPLFLTAAGLVMEVGGMMTHGAVVAREYGLPAIVGVDQATRRLQTGQLIRINGSTGQIELLPE